MCIVPPYTKKARYTEAQFLEDFDSYLDELCGKHGIIVMAGDFNIHVEKFNDHYSKKFLGNYFSARFDTMRSTKSDS